MGNCNFKTEYENDNVTGKTCLMKLQLYSYIQEPFSISLCHWQGWFWKSVESRKEERKKAVRHERNA